jgi:hypothetical protein
VKQNRSPGSLVLRPLVLAFLLFILLLASMTGTALPGDIDASISLVEDELEAEPWTAADTVVFHGNVSFDQPRYQRGIATISASVENNWTVDVPSSRLTHRGPGEEAFTVSVTVPRSALGRETTGLTVTAQYSTVLGTGGEDSTTAVVRVKSWYAYDINASGPIKAEVAQGDNGVLSIPVENIGNEADYYTVTVPYWYGLRSYGISVDNLPRTLIRAHEEEVIDVVVSVGSDTFPRRYEVICSVDAQGLEPGKGGAQFDPRNVTAEILVTGIAAPDHPYETWSVGEGPDPAPGIDPIFGSAGDRWYPDIDSTGQYVTYAQRDFDPFGLWIYLAFTDGSWSRQLTRTSEFDRTPVFSPDGQRIAFVRDSRRVIVIDHNGTEQLELVPGMRSMYLSDWSPTGHRVLLTSDGDIYELDLNTNTSRLLAGEPVYQRGGTYSPDGGRIFYLSDEAAGTEPEVWSMASDGSDHQQLTFNDLRETSVTISPNGKRVAFTIEKEEEYGDRICVMASDGTGARLITSHSSSVEELRWLPDGSGLLTEAGRREGIILHDDLHLVEYPWDDAVGVDGTDTGNGGDGAGDELSPALEFLVNPFLWLVVILVVVGVAGSRVVSRRMRRRREEIIAELKERIEKKEEERVEAPVEAPPYDADAYYKEYGVGYRRYDYSEEPPRPRPMHSRVVRNHR